MTRKQVTMDRIFELVKNINDQWTKTNSELQILALTKKDNELKEIYRQYDQLRNDFANIITLGQDDAWRFLAEANGIELPNENDKYNE